MKYLKKRNPFLEDINKVEKNEKILIENVNYHRTEVKHLGEVILPDPKHGDFKLSVMPFENNGKWVSLPEGFELWEKTFNDILKHIPLQEGANTHYVTIDTKFFTTDDFLRREGIHIDGNFCVDPYFTSSITEMASWGGASYQGGGSSWGGASYKTPETSKSSWGGAGYSPVKSSWGGAGYSEIKASWGGASPKSSWGGASPKSSWGGASPKSSWGGARPTPKSPDDPKKIIKIWDKSERFRLEEKENGIYKLVREGKFEEKPDNSHVKMDWVLPYDNIIIPISEYVSSEKGGILTVSTEVGAQAWDGEFYGEVLSEGAFDNMLDQLTDDRKKVFEKNQLYFMTSNTPHETLMIEKGKRRTFLRITLNHNYDNSLIK